MDKRIIALLGVPGSGKGIAKRALIEVGFVEIGMLSPVNLMLQHGLSIPPELLGGDDQRLPIAEYGAATPAQMRKSLARDWGRFRVHSDIWTVAWKRLVDAQPHDVVLSDAGYANEAAAVRAAGGEVWRIEGNAQVERAYDRHEAEIIATRTLRNEGGNVSKSVMAALELYGQ